MYIGRALFPLLLELLSCRVEFYFRRLCCFLHLFEFAPLSLNMKLLLFHLLLMVVGLIFFTDDWRELRLSSDSCMA